VIQRKVSSYWGMKRCRLGCEQDAQCHNFLRKQGQKNGGQKNVYGFSLLHGEYFLDDSILHVSVFHFSVFAFVQINLALPSSNKAFNSFAPNRFAFLIKLVTLGRILAQLPVTAALPAGAFSSCERIHKVLS
jgi:hypothetical protein